VAGAAAAQVVARAAAGVAARVVEARVVVETEEEVRVVVRVEAD